MRLRPFYYAGWGLIRLTSWLLFNPRVIGREHIPRQGGFIMASNHISYFDPPLLGSWQTRQMYFFAKQELFRNRLFGALNRACNSIPVKRGSTFLPRLAGTPAWMEFKGRSWQLSLAV